MYLIYPHKKKFKASQHSHTIRSDDKLAAEEMKKSANLLEKDFLMLTG